MAVGLSARLLCTLQPVSMLVCRHLSARISKRGGFHQKMSSFEIMKVDAIALQILHT
jgi:hypothetical protein